LNLPAGSHVAGGASASGKPRDYTTEDATVLHGIVCKDVASSFFVA